MTRALARLLEELWADSPLVRALNLSKRIAKALADALKSVAKAAGRALWKAFWHGSLVSAIVVLVIVVIGVSYALSAVGASPADTSSVLSLLGGVATIMLLLRAFKYMLSA
jgi:uncharacterized membrane protein YhaH (DUF805 family)